MNPSHAISAWLGDGPYYLKSPMYVLFDGYHIKWVWLNLDYSCGLHEAADLPLIPFDRSRDNCIEYIDRACRLLGRSNPGWNLSTSEAKMVTDALGSPPLASYSIYIMTVSDLNGENERAVYVGRTNAEAQRFRGGHAAISKLHHPKFEGLRKRIHFGCVSALNDDNHTFPVEWTNPFEKRDEILHGVELQLIFELQPELNDHGRHECLAKTPVHIIIQNPSGRFLDGMPFGPSPLE
jgi:hypothetical protein